jgi:hypothetical protein
VLLGFDGVLQFSFVAFAMAAVGSIVVLGVYRIVSKPKAAQQEGLEVRDGSAGRRQGFHSVTVHARREHL